MKQSPSANVNRADGEGAAAGAGRFGFDFIEHEKTSMFAAQIILHLIMIACKIESQNSLLREKNQPPLQIRPALESVRRNFSDA